MSNFLASRIDNDELVTTDTSETQTVLPNGVCNWYLIGTKNASFNIVLQRERGSGGHQHDGGPTGQLAPSSGYLDNNGNATIIYSAPIVAGLIKLQTEINGVRVADDFVKVGVSGLVALSSSANIVLIGKTPTHPDNHYGHPALISLLEVLAKYYKDKFQKPVYVNDISLVFGGLFDIKGNWNTPHKEHQLGTSVDIRSVGLPNEQYLFLKNKAIELGFTVLVEDTPPHFHMKLKVSHKVIKLWRDLHDSTDSLFLVKLKSLV